MGHVQAFNTTSTNTMNDESSFNSVWGADSFITGHSGQGHSQGTSRSSDSNYSLNVHTDNNSEDSGYSPQTNRQIEDVWGSIG